MAITENTEKVATIGYMVVLTPEGATPSADWDGELHEDRADAVRELKCARDHGYKCVLAMLVECFEESGERPDLAE